MKMQDDPKTFSTTASRRDDARDRQILFHRSCDAFMSESPLGKSLPMIPVCNSNGWRKQNGFPISLTSHGITYNVGRNKAKREARK